MTACARYIGKELDRCTRGASCICLNEIIRDAARYVWLRDRVLMYSLEPDFSKPSVERAHRKEIDQAADAGIASQTKRIHP